MLAMNKKSHHGGFYTDYLCFFRCLSVKLRCKCKTICLCKRVNEHHAKLLFGKFKRQTGYSGSCRQFKGVRTKHLLELEKLFKVSITVFQLSAQGNSNVIRSSRVKYTTKLHLNLYENHFSLIKRLDIYASAFDCIHCESSYTRLSALKRHTCDANKKRLAFANKCYNPNTANPTVFDIVDNKTGVYVENHALLSV